ncbi:MAG: phosphatase PAP2 family protein [Spirochaetales bacterium]|nr:phosphatase PAP2 family protein [Spirochaetales bacterium]
MKKLFNGCMNIDARLFLRIYSLSGKKILDYFFYYVTKIGDGWFYAVLLGIYLIIYTRDAISILPALITAYAIDTGIYIIVKKKVKRARPFKKIEGITSLVIPPDEFSFPSGHTAAAAVLAIIGSNCFPEIKYFLFFYVALIGFSRIYNGVHYPFDVFAGASLGIISGKIGLAIF